MKIGRIVEWAREKNYEFAFFGNEEDEIDGFSSLNKYKPGSITWVRSAVSDDKDYVKSIRCAVVQVGLQLDISNIFYSGNSKELFFAILKQFFSQEPIFDADRKGSYIGKDVLLEDSVHIGANCVLDGEIHIGRGTVIEHNVVIMNKVTIGDNCIIHSGTVIGKDGFGFAFNKDNLPVKVHHFGGVIIGDRVEIGANCTVDRGTIDNTLIHDDVKIDNLVLIAHNTEIGKGTLVVGCTDIAGSSKIGEKCYIGPQVCVKNQVSIGNNSFVGMDVMVNESFADSMMLIKQQNAKPVKNKNYRRFI